MHFSIGDAWADSMRMIINRPLAVFGTALLFLILQYLPIGALFGVFYASFDPLAAAGPDTNPLATAGFGVGLVLAMFLAYFLMILVGIIGQMVMMVLLHNRPGSSFGSAFRDAMRATPGMLMLILLAVVAYFVVVTVVAMFVGLAMVLGSAASEVAGIVISVALGLICFLAFLYLFTRLSLTMPSMVLANLRNPFTALGRSWKLTSAAPWKLLAFYIVLVAVIAALYIGALYASQLISASMMVDMVSDTSETTGSGITAIIGVMALVVAGTVAVGVLAVACVTAAYRQLADDEDIGLSETFS